MPAYVKCWHGLHAGESAEKNSFMTKYMYGVQRPFQLLLSYQDGSFTLHLLEPYRPATHINIAQFLLGQE